MGDAGASASVSTVTRQARPIPASRALVSLRPPQGVEAEPAGEVPVSRGFGGFAGGKGARGAKGRGRKGSGLAASDRQPLGKSPDHRAMIDRRRLGLPLTGRLTPADVARAYRQLAGEHHPDRGGGHDRMQAINGARDRLLGKSA
jgi:hypothetical protein